MTTWSCKPVLLALVLGLGLSACAEQIENRFSLIPRLGGDTPEEPKRPDVALARANLVGGALSLVPPEGYCVDKRGLRDDFAIVARCDSLGSETTDFDASLGLILVSATAVSGDPDVEALLPATFSADVDVLEQFAQDNLALSHLNGGAPEGVDPIHWRGLIHMHGHLISLTAYAPEGGSLATAEGGRVLTALANEMHAASANRDVLATTKPSKTRTRGGLRDRINGLFNRKAFVE